MAGSSSLQTDIAEKSSRQWHDRHASEYKTMPLLIPSVKLECYCSGFLMEENPISILHSVRSQVIKPLQILKEKSVLRTIFGQLVGNGPTDKGKTIEVNKPFWRASIAIMVQCRSVGKKPRIFFESVFDRRRPSANRPFASHCSTSIIKKISTNLSVSFLVVDHLDSKSNPTPTSK